MGDWNYYSNGGGSGTYVSSSSRYWASYTVTTQPPDPPTCLRSHQGSAPRVWVPDFRRRGHPSTLGSGMCRRVGVAVDGGL